jgi:hypothetical protein
MADFLKRVVSSRVFVAVVAGVAVAAASSIAWATIPDSSGVIHGCYQMTSGALRVIDTDVGGRCLSAEKTLNWNQTGPSDAFSKSIDGPVSVSASTTRLTVASLTISVPGTYVVWAKAYFTHDPVFVSSANLDCALEAGNDIDVTRGVSGPEGVAGSELLPLGGLIMHNLVHEFTSPGSVDFKCTVGNPSDAHFIKITAIKVGSLTRN